MLKMIINPNPSLNVMFFTSKHNHYTDSKSSNKYYNPNFNFNSFFFGLLKAIMRLVEIKNGNRSLSVDKFLKQLFGKIPHY
jgi:hypothetical protein